MLFVDLDRGTGPATVDPSVPLASAVRCSVLRKSGETVVQVFNQTCNGSQLKIFFLFSKLEKLLGAVDSWILTAI